MQIGPYKKQPPTLRQRIEDGFVSTVMAVAVAVVFFAIQGVMQ